jgi:hypothetical protein
MLVARNSYFDNWSWPPALLFIFVGNLILSATAWAILRRSAAGIKKSALEALNRNLREAERDIADKKTSAEKTPETSGTQTSSSAKDELPSPAVRKIGLLEIKRRIEEERRGAYSRWFQDPAFLAMLIPTGLLGILSILLQALFGFM